jgi:hypothetical protein
LDRLQQNDLTLPDPVIAEIVRLSVHHARKQARIAKKNHDRSSGWRLNLESTFDAITSAMLKASRGEIHDSTLFCVEVKELLRENAVLFDASEIKVAEGTSIRCEELHHNGLFIARILESERIALRCMSFKTDRQSGNAFLCQLCGRPVAKSYDGRHWFVCAGEVWVG